jgi:type IV pilus assembly protein PilN
MRLNINLASQPYEVARTYQRRMTILIGVLSAVAVILLGYIFYQRAHSRAINQQLAIVQGQIDSLNHEEEQARAILNKPANKVIADQSEFLNELFARKSMSWTYIFTVMEKIVPPELHVVSMKPDYSKTNDLVVHVIVATDSRNRAVELVRNMEKSSHFRQPQVAAEAVVANTSDQSGQGGGIQFDIAAIYVPGAQDTDEKAAPSPVGDKIAPVPQAAAPAKKSPLPSPTHAAPNVAVNSGYPAGAQASNTNSGQGANSLNPNVPQSANTAQNNNPGQNPSLPPSRSMRLH